MEFCPMRGGETADEMSSNPPPRLVLSTEVEAGLDSGTCGTCLHHRITMTLRATHLALALLAPTLAAAAPAPPEAAPDGPVCIRVLNKIICS